jgi:hypothetical protein
MVMAQPTNDINLHLNHNVYILGAGFSYDAGLPLLNNFLNEMRASVVWLSSQANRDAEVRAIKEVFRFRKEASSAALRINLNIENIEDLFSLAAASGQYPLAQSVSTAIAGTLDYSKRHAPANFARVNVEHTFNPPDHWTTITPGPTSAMRRIPIYELYAGMLSGRFCVSDENMRNTVITFNYDTVLEDALAAIQVRSRNSAAKYLQGIRITCKIFTERNAQSGKKRLNRQSFTFMLRVFMFHLDPLPNI